MNEQAKAQAADELSRALGPGKVISDAAEVMRYSNGSFRDVPGLLDQWRYLISEPVSRGPDLIVKPLSTKDVAETVKLANRMKIPIIPWGGASNFVGADSAPSGGIVVDTRGMDRVLKIDAERLFAKVQAGVRLMDLQKELQKHGLRHGSLPGSALWATVGGAIAFDAHTLTGFRYGTISENILELEVVLPTGETIRTGPWYNTGYNLRDLFTRSEGTLGIVTEVTFKVQRVQPYRVSYGYAFQTFSEALRAHHALCNSGLPELSTIMTFDRFTSKYPEFSRAMGGTEAEAGTLLTLEGRENSVKEAEQIVRSIVKPREGHTIPPRVGALVDDWWSLLIDGPAHTINSGEGLEVADWKVGPHVWVSQEKVEAVRDAFVEIVGRHGMKYTGIVYTPTRLLLQFLYSHEGREGCGKAYKEILKDIGPVVHGAGGTLTGCHGSGLVFKEEMELVYGNALPVMRSLKRALDPNGIMNPGKLLD